MLFAAALFNSFICEQHHSSAPQCRPAARPDKEDIRPPPTDPFPFPTAGQIRCVSPYSFSVTHTSLLLSQKSKTQRIYGNDIHHDRAGSTRKNGTNGMEHTSAAILPTGIPRSFRRTDSRSSIRSENRRTHDGAVAGNTRSGLHLAVRLARRRYAAQRCHRIRPIDSHLTARLRLARRQTLSQNENAGHRTWCSVSEPVRLPCRLRRFADFAFFLAGTHRGHSGV